MFKNMGGNIPGGNFLGGHFPGGEFSPWAFDGREYSGWEFSRGNFPDTVWIEYYLRLNLSELPKILVPRLPQNPSNVKNECAEN